MPQTFELKDIDSIAKELLASYAKVSDKYATVMGFTGDLGVGKTTLIQAIARALGVSENVTSPTFVLQKNYPLTSQSFDTLVHIDTYRIESIDELGVLHFDELLKQSRTLILIEWPERIASALPVHTKLLTLEIIDDHTRKLTSQSANKLTHV
jgi:tRNA threonylcarbamoyladenosine biosynthesis protein TsaE